MDNQNAGDPQEAAGATAAQGQSQETVATQPSGTENVASDNQSGNEGEASNPWDNDPKFKGKSASDIYQAYQEVEKLSGQLSQKAQIANLIEEKYGVTPEQLRAQIEQQEIQQQNQYYQENPLAPVLDRMSQLENIVQQQNQEREMSRVNEEISDFIEENPAYKDNEDLLRELALTPTIGFDPNTGENLLSLNEIATKYIGNARAQGQQDAYKKIDTKLNTQATSSQSGDSKPITQDDLKNMSVKELEAILPSADVSNRPVR